MTSKFIKCRKCGKVNPATARVCMDCNTILEKKPIAEEPTEPIPIETTAHTTASGDTPPYGEKSPHVDTSEDARSTEAPDSPGTDQDVGMIQNLEKYGAEYDDVEPESRDIYEKSRAFEVERHAAVDTDQSVELSAELETHDDALMRQSEESAKFRKEDELQQLKPRPRPAEQRRMPAEQAKPKTHRSPWEKSDVEIMANLRRGQIARSLSLRVVPLVVLAVLIVLGGQYILFPAVLPGGTWNGSVIDSAGDVVRFAVRLQRTGSELSGNLWLIDTDGNFVEGVPSSLNSFILQGVFDAAPMGVIGSFNKRNLDLLVYSLEDSSNGKTLRLEGKLTGIGKAEGRATNYRNVEGTWTLIRNNTR